MSYFNELVGKTLTAISGGHFGRGKPIKSVSASLPVSVPLSLAMWAAILTLIL